MRCILDDELPSTSYRDRKDRLRVVRYWAMRPVEQVFVVPSDIDQVRWVSPAAAAEVLTYEHDRELLATVLRWLRSR